MEEVIFEIETGLKADEHRETFTQWQLVKSMQSLQETLDNLHDLLEQFSIHVQKQINNTNMPGGEAIN